MSPKLLLAGALLLVLVACGGDETGPGPGSTTTVAQSAPTGGELRIDGVAYPGRVECLISQLGGFAAQLVADGLRDGVQAQVNFTVSSSEAGLLRVTVLDRASLRADVDATDQRSGTVDGMAWTVEGLTLSLRGSVATDDGDQLEVVVDATCQTS